MQHLRLKEILSKWLKKVISQHPNMALFDFFKRKKRTVPLEWKKNDKIVYPNYYYFLDLRITFEGHHWDRNNMPDLFLGTMQNGQGKGYYQYSRKMYNETELERLEEEETKRVEEYNKLLKENLNTDKL